mgnify:CR=1 FL=1
MAFFGIFTAIVPRKLLKFQKMIQPLHFQHGLLQVKIKQMTLIQLNLKDIKRAALMQF